MFFRVNPFNRYSELERWLNTRLDRKLNNGTELGWTSKKLRMVGGLLMVSVPAGVDEISPYSDFR
jgi:hypothetical protein